MPRERAWQPEVMARIALDEAALAAFCDRWRVASLELFGSVIRDDFRHNSDIDVLVSFQPEANWGLLDHAAMEDELAALFGRSVDLLSRRAVERSANPIRRASILESAVPLFIAPRASGGVLAKGSERGDT
jgi:predicted nucleotidyltransferase